MGGSCVNNTTASPILAHVKFFTINTYRHDVNQPISQVCLCYWGESKRFQDAFVVHAAHCNFALVILISVCKINAKVGLADFPLVDKHANSTECVMHCETF